MDFLSFSLASPVLLLEHVISGVALISGAIAVGWGIRQRKRVQSISSNASIHSGPSIHPEHSPDQYEHLVNLIQELEATQHAMLKMLPDLILRFKGDGSYVERLSSGDLHLLCADDDVQGKTIYQTIPLPLAEKRMQYVKKALATKTIQKFEQCFEHEGVTQYEEVRVIPRGDDEVLVAVRDMSDQKRAQDALIQSEKLNRAIIDVLPDLIIRMARDGTYLDVRSASNFCMIQAPETLVGKNVRDILPEASVQQRLEMAERAITTGKLQSYEFPLTIAGAERWQEARIVALTQDEVLVVIRDMTERKRAVDELRYRESQHQAILTAIPDLIFRLRADGIYLGYVQTSTFTDLLPPSVDPIGKHVTEYLSPDHARRHLHYTALALETGKPQVYEQEVVIQGQVQYEEVRVVASGDDEVLFIVRDISDRKRSELERTRMKLRLQQQLNRVLLLEQITNEIRSSLDSQSILQVAVNQVGCAFGANRCLIHSYEEGVPPRIPFVAEYVDSSYPLLPGMEIPVEGNAHAQEIIRRDGAIASNNVYEDPLLVAMHHLCNRMSLKSMLVSRTSYQGQPNGVICLHQCDRFRYWTQDEIDLFEAVASQLGIALHHAHLLEQEIQRREELALKNDALEKAKYEAEAANRAKSTFLATMSHELRTPLNIILGFAQVMHSSPHLPVEHQEDAQLIFESGQYLLNLINSVLELSKIEAGVVPLHLHSFELDRFVHAIRLMFVQQIQQKGLCFNVEIAANVPTRIVADEGKIRQILINLLDNALKFTDQGAISLRVNSIDLETMVHSEGVRGDTRTAITPSALQSAAKPVGIRFEIQDSGCGIASTDRAKIFEAFVQTEIGERTPGGTGLGLAISKKFAHFMGGDLLVQSVVGQGTTFYLDIPVEIEQEGAIALSPPIDNTQLDLTPHRHRLSSQDFEVMTTDWVKRLYEALIRCDDQAAQALLAEIPPQEAMLARELGILIHTFQFEKIMRLIEQSASMQ